MHKLYLILPVVLLFSACSHQEVNTDLEDIARFKAEMEQDEPLTSLEAYRLSRDQQINAATGRFQSYSQEEQVSPYSSRR